MPLVPRSHEKAPLPTIASSPSTIPIVQLPLRMFRPHSLESSVVKLSLSSSAGHTAPDGVPPPLSPSKMAVNTCEPDDTASRGRMKATSKDVKSNSNSGENEVPSPENDHFVVVPSWTIFQMLCAPASYRTFARVEA